MATFGAIHNTRAFFRVKNQRRNAMDRNEDRKSGWDNDGLAESLKKHKREHRDLASILLNLDNPKSAWKEIDGEGGVR